MTEKRKFHAVRGVRDILPPDTSLWNWFEATARDVFESFNFREIRVPVLEETELFARALGTETDVVAKEIFTLQSRPESIQRAELARDALQRIGDVKHVSRIIMLLQHLAVMVRNLQIAVQQGHLPRDMANLHNVGLLEGYLKEGEKTWRTHDLRPDAYWDALFEKARTASANVRFEEIGTAGRERKLDLEETTSLRPEATASVVRAYIEHGMQMLPGLVKLYYAGPMFRRERPQKGRYRQFYQIGAEVLGQTDHPAIDAELIEMLTVLLGRCKLENWTLLVNSIGDTNCRPAYVALLREELQKVKDQLGPDSQRRIETNPLRVLDSKLPEEQPIIAKLPMISDHLCDACRKHFADLREQLDLRSIPYKVEPRLVRGLDYYMRTTFEITSPHLGAQNALAGGGRYDGLSEMLGGPPAKGIGFALGEDRFIEVIQTAGRIDAARALDAFIVWMGAAAYPAAVRLARRLRQEGLCVEVPAEEPKLRKALSLAERLGARFAVIIGENEVQSGEFTVKRFADGEQRKLAEDDVAAFVKTSAPATRKTETKSEPADS